MSRPLRIKFPGAIYLVMYRRNGPQDIVRRRKWAGLLRRRLIPLGHPHLGEGPLTDRTLTHRTCDMKNITLSVDEKVLATARRYAAERGSSVNALVREFLLGISQRRDRASEARKRIRAMSRKSKARIGSAAWSRDELHER